MEHTTHHKTATPNNLATFSLVVGIFGLFSLLSPPMQLLLGASAIMLAVISKKGKPFAVPSIIGLSMGIVSVILSFIMFGYLIFVMDLMKDPEYAPLFDQVMEQYKSILNEIQTQ